MTRREYLALLDKELSILRQDARQAALSFYTEMLDDRMEDGMDEESAVAAMEAPEEIARRLRAEGGGEERTSPLHVGVRDEALEFSSLADSVLKNVQKALENIPEKTAAIAERAVQEAEKTAEKAEDAARETARRARETAEAIRKEAPQASGQAAAPGEFERRVFSCPAENITAVKLLVQDMPVAVKEAKDDQVTLVYYASIREPYTACVTGGTLTLENPEKGKTRGFSFFFEGLRLIWDRPAPTVELWAPAAALMDLTVRTSNGSIRVEGLKALCETDIRTSNSRISVQQVTCKTLDAQTSNSRLVLEGVTAKQGLAGKTSNSRVEASGVRAGGGITLTTSNGRAILEEVRSRSSLAVTTSNSGITVSALEAASLSLRTSNGSIKGTLPGRQADWAISSGTSNGKSTLPRHQEGSKPLSVFTSNGNIDLSFQQDSH